MKRRFGICLILAVGSSIWVSQLYAVPPAPRRHLGAILSRSIEDRESFLEAADEDGDTGGGGGTSSEDNEGKRKESKRIIVKEIGASPRVAIMGARERSWLGVSTEEASEALSAQLGLDSGVGLTVNYVATNSPAAKGGLMKNDVLTEFEGQLLVHPAQLRKLVQARKQGDKVKVIYYRGGKKEDATVEIGKNKEARFGLEGDSDLRRHLEDLHLRLGDIHIEPALREQLDNAKRSIMNIHIDRDKLQQELKSSLDEARVGLRQAWAHASTGPANKSLTEVEQADNVVVDKDAHVVVRSNADSIKSVVKSDDSGTIVIVSNPKSHLTAHDKKGKLLFDGEIDTKEQRAKVPKDLWKRIEPMLDDMGSGKAEQSE